MRIQGLIDRINLVHCCIIDMTQQKQQKSNTKNSNPKIGRPAKTDQEEQFKNHYMQNRKKFQLQCQLLVYIHHIFFEQIPTHPTNQRVGVAEMVKLFEMYDCMKVYKTLAKLNQHYFKSSSLFPQEKLRYTSLIDVGYMMRQVKIDYGDKMNSYEVILLIFFFLFNQKVVNAGFYDYFRKRVQIFRNGMINGPDHCELNKMDTLIIALALQVAIKEEMLIEEQVQVESDQEIKSPSPQFIEHEDNQINYCDQQYESESNEELDQQSLQFQKIQMVNQIHLKSSSQKSQHLQN